MKNQKLPELTNFRTSTIGLMASHKKIKTPKLLRVDIYNTEDSDKVALVVVSGRNLNKMPVPVTFVDIDEYENSPEDPYDDTVFAKWSFRKCQLSL